MTADTEVDDLMVQAIKVLRFHHLEIEKVRGIQIMIRMLIGVFKLDDLIHLFTTFMVDL